MSEMVVGLERIVPSYSQARPGHRPPGNAVAPTTPWPSAVEVEDPPESQADVHGSYPVVDPMVISTYTRLVAPSPQLRPGGILQVW